MTKLKSESDARTADATEVTSAPTDSDSKDRGDWKYRPWKGVDHWVNERTKARTFNARDLI